MEVVYKHVPSGNEMMEKFGGSNKKTVFLHWKPSKGKSRGFNSSRVAGRSTRLQRPNYPLGHTVRTSSKTRSQLRILAKKIGKIGFML